MRWALSHRLRLRVSSVCLKALAVSCALTDQYTSGYQPIYSDVPFGLYQGCQTCGPQRESGLPWSVLWPASCQFCTCIRFI